MGSNDEHCDVTFFVDGQRLRAHKLFVREASPVLRKMIEECQDGQELSEIELRDELAVSVQVFEQLRKFIYIGKIDSEFAKDMLTASNQVWLIVVFKIESALTSPS